MKKLLVVCALVVMTGCTEKEKDTTPVTPDSMKDCEFIWMKRSADYIGVVICPLSVTVVEKVI